MAVRFPASPVNPFPPSRPLDRRTLRALAAAALLAVSSCSVLPPSMRSKAEAAPTPQAAPGPRAQLGPLPAGKVATVDGGAGKAEAKVFKGSGPFLNPKPPLPPTPP